MTDLGATFGSLRLSNPVVVASGTPGWDGAHLKKAAEAGAAAVITKTIGVSDEPVMHPHCGRFILIKSGTRPIGMVNVELSSTITKDRWLEEELRLARHDGTRLFASVLAQPSSAETARLVAETADTGLVDLIELNVSAPIAGGTLGARIGQRATLVHDAVKAAKAASSIPVSVKLTPNVSDITEVAKAAAEAGADGLVVSNSVMGFAGVDIRSGRPLLPAFGGYTGPAIKPIVSKLVADVYRSTSLPVMAVGGVSTWEDVIEYIMLGASAVQICTALMWGGYGVIPRLIWGISDFMEAQGHSSLDQIRGIALGHLVSISEYARSQRRYALVDESSCNGCGKCGQVCFFDAVILGEGVAKVKRNSCDGCGLCVQWCPKRAMELVL